MSVVNTDDSRLLSTFGEVVERYGDILPAVLREMAHEEKSKGVPERNDAYVFIAIAKRIEAGLPSLMKEGEYLDERAKACTEQRDAACEEVLHKAEALLDKIADLDGMLESPHGLSVGYPRQHGRRLGGSTRDNVPVNAGLERESTDGGSDVHDIAAGVWISAGAIVGCPGSNGPAWWYGTGSTQASARRPSPARGVGCCGVALRGACRRSVRAVAHGPAVTGMRVSVHRNAWPD